MSTVVVSNWIIIANVWMTITQLHSAHSPRPCLNWIWVWFRCPTVLYVVSAKIKEPTWHGPLSGWGRRSSSGIGCWAPTARSGRRTKPSLSQYTGPSPLIPGINPGYRTHTAWRETTNQITGFTPRDKNKPFTFKKRHPLTCEPTAAMGQPTRMRTAHKVA